MLDYSILANDLHSSHYRTTEEVSIRSAMMAKSRIQIVEDEIILAKEMQYQLESMGYEVVGIAPTGNDAVRMAKKFKPDLVLLDIRLKGDMNGIETARAINRERRTPVIFNTAYSDAHTLAEAKETEPYGFIPKPADPRILKTTIEMAIKRFEVEQQLMANEEKIRESEERLSILFEYAPDAYYINDMMGTLLDGNHAAEKLTGYQKDELVGKNFFQLNLLSLDQVPKAAKLLARNKLKKSTGPDEFRLMRKDNSTVDVEIRTYPIKIRNQMVVLGIARDITERKKAENELKSSEERYRTLAETMMAGIVIADENENITFVNPATCRMLQYKKAELLKLNMADITVPEEFNKMRNSTGRRKKGINEQYEVKLKKMDGRFLDGLISASPLFDHEGRYEGSLGVLLDVTEMRSLERQLNQTQKLESIGRLAAGIAHEINTPTQYVGDNIRFLQDTFRDLMTLQGKYDFVIRDLKAERLTSTSLNELEELKQKLDMDFLQDEIPQAIDQSLEGLDRVSKIVRAMKEFSHPGEEETQDFDINKAIQTTITVTRNEWKYTADLETELDPNLPLVHGHPDEFNQVILNLITNAVHAISSKHNDGLKVKGLIRILTKMRDDGVEIEISDTGTGIPEDVQDHIFDPFYTTKPVGQGTGQGLAICRNIVVQKFNGSISFDTKQAEGTRFFIYLPLAEQQVQEQKKLCEAVE